MRIMSRLFFVISIVSLVACGGGGGGNDSVSDSEVSPEGLYVGTTSNDSDFFGVILNNGEYYFLYSSSFYQDEIGGVFLGDLTTDGNSFSSTNGIDLSIDYYEIYSADVSGNFTEKVSISGSASYSNEVVSFSGTYDPDYEKTPSLSAVSGNYLGEVATSYGVEGADLSISSSGIISGESDNGCTASGTIDPRSSGNVYDVTLSFQGGSCVFGTQTFSGIAYYLDDVSGIYAIAPNSSRDDGVLFVGQKY